MRILRLASVLAATTVLLVPGAAAANAAAPFSRPTGAIPGVVVERGSPVVVAREDLTIDCTKDPDPIHPSCDVVAIYHLQNPSGADEELAGAFFYVSRGKERDASVKFGVHLDGADVRSEAEPSMLERLDAIAREDPEVALLTSPESGHALGRQPFRIVVPGGGHAQLVFDGPLPPASFAHRNPREGYVIPPIATRHVNFASTRGIDWDAGDESYLYLLSPLRRWAGDPEIAITIRHHPDSVLSIGAPSAGWTRRRDGAADVATARVRASSAENLRFRFVYTPPLLKRGGPVLGIGPRIGREELRVRAGWEVGLGQSFVLGASVESNFSEYLIAAATLDAATPDLVFVIPSIGIGAGVPVQLRRGTSARVGARAQATIAFPFVSFLFPIDFYPAANSSGSHVEGAFLTQLSF